MLLSAITTDPARFQFRDEPFSRQTVEAIVSEGIDLAKFDPLPLIRLRKGVYCIAGDGHSRLEAIRRLAESADLPMEWAIEDSGEWDVPARIVSAAAARDLAWTANMSRHSFTPAEEAKVFQAMLDTGLSIEEVAHRAHRSATHVTRALPLNELCQDIRAAVGASPEAGGIDVLTGQVLAAGFARFGIDKARQQELWHRCLKHAMLNFQSAKKFIDSIGAKFAETAGDAFLFQLPVNAETVLREARERVSGYRAAKMGLSLLIKAAASGGLEHLPELAAWITGNAADAVNDLSKRVTEDGEILAAMVAA